MDTEAMFIEDEDLDELIERQGDVEREYYDNNDDDDDDENRERRDDEAEEAPAPKADTEKKAEGTKRKLGPRPKLDSVRLAGPRGLLALELETKDIRLKGRGHEIEDMDKVLAAVQHWAHRLFPSYTFDDCLAKLEKLGSKKNVNVQVKKIRMGMTSVEDIHDTTIRGEDNEVVETIDEATETDDWSSFTNNTYSNNVSNTVQSSNEASTSNAPSTAQTSHITQSVTAPTTSIPSPPPVTTTNRDIESMKQSGLTDEQIERMNRSRIAAEERRKKRLQELEQQSQTNEQ